MVKMAGAFRNIGRDRIADDIVATMRAADYDVRESDPFETKPSIIQIGRELSPYVNRLRLMWHAMRETVIERFPEAPGLPKDIKTYMHMLTMFMPLMLITSYRLRVIASVPS